MQAQLDAGSAAEPVRLMREVGLLRQELEQARGGMSLNVPEQEVVPTADGRLALHFRAGLLIEDWNAQISLLTGIAAAKLMLAGGVGVLRTMPPAQQWDVDRLRRIAKALHISWPGSVSYGLLLAGMDGTKGHEAAFLSEATSLFRGAAYASFEGAPPALTTMRRSLRPTPTAPHRCAGWSTGTRGRSVSRCRAGTPVPAWVLEALPALPAEMAEGIHRGNQLDHANVDLVEAAVLAPGVGQVFPATVVDVDAKRGGGTVQLAEPAVLARCDGNLPLGDAVQVKLVTADVATRTVAFTRVG